MWVSSGISDGLRIGQKSAEIRGPYAESAYGWQTSSDTNFDTGGGSPLICGERSCTAKARKH